MPADAAVAQLQPVLAELEATRRVVARQIKQRVLWQVPLGAAIGAGTGVVFDQLSVIKHVMILGDVAVGFGALYASFFVLGLCVLFGGVFGYLWAARDLRENYRSLYKKRVLPLLAARYGAITYRRATPPNMKPLREERIFPEYHRVIAEDELAGVIRGCALRIVEFKLTVRRGKHRREHTIFDGLAVEIRLARNLAGTTAVLADGGAFGNFRNWLAESGRQRVRLEDPRFERVYQVWGSDQVAARALLTPAFMERLLALGDRPGFGRPLALARDNQLTVVIPKRGKINYFEPPSVFRPAAGRDTVMRLDKDIAAVLAVAEAVVDLDSRTRGIAAAKSSQDINPAGEGPEVAAKPA
jgi:hypothetical protein